MLFFYQSNCTALVVCSVFFSAYLKGILTDDVILTGLIESKAYDAQIPTYGTGFLPSRYDWIIRFLASDFLMDFTG